MCYRQLARQTSDLIISAFERPVARGDDEADARYCLVISHHKNRPGDARYSRKFLLASKMISARLRSCHHVINAGSLNLSMWKR